MGGCVSMCKCDSGYKFVCVWTGEIVVCVCV